MRSLFRSKHRVTQNFGVNPEYYAKFGLKAHEGLDLVPTGTVWDVLCLADGVVVKDEDNALSGAYGKNVTVWHTKLRKATQYCHLKENYVTMGQIVSAGEKLGLMGATGNTKGAHVHLNLFETDENGIRQNRTNGYLGGIDPLLFLEEETPIVAAPDLQTELDAVRKARDLNWSWFTGLCEVMRVAAVYETAKSELEKLVAIEDKYNQAAGQLTDSQKQISDLRSQLTSVTKDYDTLQSSYNGLREQLAEGQATIQGLKDNLAQLEKAVMAPVRRGWKAFLVALVDKL